MRYPIVLGEWATMKLAVEGRSIARFGDGELRLALSEGKHIAQDQDPKLTAELKEILWTKQDALVCIPNSQAPNGKPVMWGPTRYGAPKYVELYGDQQFGSSFVTRPDSAPWIDTDEYWTMCRSLWYQRDVTLVMGTRGGSITHLSEAKSVRKIFGPERSAYEKVDEMMDWIGTPDHPVLICLGPCATALATRLARKGVHALDLGHLGRFMPQKFLP